MKVLLITANSIFLSYIDIRFLMRNIPSRVTRLLNCKAQILQGILFLFVNIKNCQGKVWAKDDLTYLEENTNYVQQREKEIHNIVQSISDLNTIFKELASMVTEQVKLKASIFFFDIGWIIS